MDLSVVTISVLPYMPDFYHYILNDGERRAKRKDEMTQFCIKNLPEKGHQILDLMSRSIPFMLDLKERCVYLLEEDKQAKETEMRRQLLDEIYRNVRTRKTDRPIIYNKREYSDWAKKTSQLETF